MAITTAMPLSFKAELLGGIHDMDTDVFKIALYTSAATLGASTTAYSATNETTGTGYTAGGNTLTGAVISSSGTTAWATFNNSTWSVATLTARGALIYNSSKANRAVAVIDFGADKFASSGDFQVTMPVADAANAIVRVS